MEQPAHEQAPTPPPADAALATAKAVVASALGRVREEAGAKSRSVLLLYEATDATEPPPAAAPAEALTRDLAPISLRVAPLPFAAPATLPRAWIRTVADALAAPYRGAPDRRSRGRSRLVHALTTLARRLGLSLPPPDAPTQRFDEAADALARRLLRHDPDAESALVRTVARAADPARHDAILHWIAARPLTRRELAAVGMRRRSEGVGATLQMLDTLGRLTRHLGPITVAVDGLEALRQHDDETGSAFRTFAALVTRIRDHVPNHLLVLSCERRVWQRALEPELRVWERKRFADRALSLGPLAELAPLLPAPPSRAKAAAARRRLRTRARRDTTAARQRARAGGGATSASPPATPTKPPAEAETTSQPEAPTGGGTPAGPPPAAPAGGPDAEARSAPAPTSDTTAAPAAAAAPPQPAIASPSTRATTEAAASVSAAGPNAAEDSPSGSRDAAKTREEAGAQERSGPGAASPAGDDTRGGEETAEAAAPGRLRRLWRRLLGRSATGTETPTATTDAPETETTGSAVAPPPPDAPAPPSSSRPENPSAAAAPAMPAAAKGEAPGGSSDAPAPAMPAAAKGEAPGGSSDAPPPAAGADEIADTAPAVPPAPAPTSSIDRPHAPATGQTPQPSAPAAPAPVSPPAAAPQPATAATVPAPPQPTPPPAGDAVPGAAAIAPQAQATVEATSTPDATGSPSPLPPSHSASSPPTAPAAEPAAVQPPATAAQPPQAPQPPVGPPANASPAASGPARAIDDEKAPAEACAPAGEIRNAITERIRAVSSPAPATQPAEPASRIPPPAPPSAPPDPITALWNTTLAATVLPPAPPREETVDRAIADMLDALRDAPFGGGVRVLGHQPVPAGKRPLFRTVQVRAPENEAGPWRAGIAITYATGRGLLSALLRLERCLAAKLCDSVVLCMVGGAHSLPAEGKRVYLRMRAHGMRQAVLGERALRTLEALRVLLQRAHDGAITVAGRPVSAGQLVDALASRRLLDTAPVLAALTALPRQYGSGERPQTASPQPAPAATPKQ